MTVGGTWRTPWRTTVIFFVVFALIEGLVTAITVASTDASSTVVSISGKNFLVNEVMTHPGTAAEGLLLNSRMVQAVFDDDNPSTVGKWAYPDTGTWDPDRNTEEFIAALPSYAARGLRAVTVNLQGGKPASGTHEWIVSAYEPNGTLKAPWLERLDRVIRACDANGIVVIVGLFYFGQDQRLQDEVAVIAAADGVTDWLLEQGYTNVLVEINNEADISYDHAILQPARVHELIQRVQERSGGQLKVSASFAGGHMPTDEVVSASDFVLLHGNSQSADGVRGMVDELEGKEAYSNSPKPIVFNEDSTSIDNLDAAVSSGASWGYYDQGKGNYVDGFQSPPVNWTINTTRKREFFKRVASLTETVGPATSSEYDLVVSSYSDRRDPVSLAGASVSGNIYVFTAPDTAEVERVEFWLDDPERSGSPEQTESQAPYDFAGGSVSTAEPFDTTALSNGSHTITAALELSSGATEIVNATFAVGN